MQKAAQAPATQTPAAPTLEQLGIAYRDLWRPGWPATLEAALQSRPHQVAIQQVAKRMGRPTLAAWQPHSLPRLPAPPTPGVRELTGPLKYGRSVYSIAQGPMVEMSVWPKQRARKTNTGPNAARATAGTCAATPRFDAKKAAANDLDH